MTGQPLIDSREPFWGRRTLWVCLALATMLPFAFITIPPFTDLPNHIARFFLFLNLGSSPFLQQYYQIEWSLIGNLGVDIPVRVLGPWLGAERATLLVISLIPPLIVAGIYALSVVTTGRVQPGALLAAMLAVNWPFMMGFVNFSLASALALLVLALWIKLRDRSFLTRLAIFAPLGFVVWIAHTSGWGLLGLGVVAYEVSRTLVPKFRKTDVLLAPLQALPLALPVLAIIFWRTQSSGGARISFSADFVGQKLEALSQLFREQFMAWDLFTTAAFLVLLTALWFVGGRKFNPQTGIIALAFWIAFLLIPTEILGSAYADWRLVPYAAILAACAVQVDWDELSDGAVRLVNVIAISALALFLARIGVTTVAWSGASANMEKRYALIDQLPPESKILGLVVRPCGTPWAQIGKPSHLPQYAITRKRSVINGIFSTPGLNQVTSRYDGTLGLVPNVLAEVGTERCPYFGSLQALISKLNRTQFDYLWIIADEAPGAIDQTGLSVVARDGLDTVFKVER